MRYHVHILVAAMSLPLACAVAASTIGSEQTPENLLQQLQAEQTSDHASEELLKLGKSRQDVKKLLVASLPRIIEKGPRQGKVWRNSVRLAGGLRVAEAAPELARWIDFVGSDFMMVLGIDPERHPAAAALVQIGDPAIPVLVRVIQDPGEGQARSPNARKRIAVETLAQMGSPAARKALEEQLKTQTDPDLRDNIKYNLEHTRTN